MAQDPQCPPQEELKYQLRDEVPLFKGDKAVPADIISKWLNDHVYNGVDALRVDMDSPFGTDVVYLEDEFADPLTRKGLLVGGVDKVTNEFKSLKFDDEGRLCVDAAISIQNIDLEVEIDVLDGDRIGIWGYEDADPDSPIPINTTGDGVVRVLTVLNNSMSNIYDEGTFSGAIEHIIVTHTVGAGEEFNVVKITACGRTNGFFKVKVNGSVLEAKRNAWTERNVEFHYAQGLPLVPGDTIDVTVVHNELTSKPFNASIYGEEL